MYKRFLQKSPATIPYLRRALRFAAKKDFPAKVTVISPHADDAAFSVAATLKLLVSAGSAIRIINCFTLSRFAPYASKHSQVTTVTRRRHEEEIFVNQLGGDSSFDDLGLVDAPARTGRGLRGILMEGSTAAELERTAIQLRQTLEDRAVEGKEDEEEEAFFAPLGIGRHVDHCISRMAAAARYAKRPIAFYEDLPYVAAATEGQIKEAIAETERSVGAKLRPMLVHWPGDAAWKQRCCAQYKSQISEASLNRITAYMERTGGERLWCSASLIDNWRWGSTTRLHAVWPKPYFV